LLRIETLLINIRDYLSVLFVSDFYFRIEEAPFYLKVLLLTVNNVNEMADGFKLAEIKLTFDIENFDTY